MKAHCTSCGIDSDQTGEYTNDNPVEADGIYTCDGLFVCTRCYCDLIFISISDTKQPNRERKDVGDAKTIQARARLMRK